MRLFRETRFWKREGLPPSSLIRVSRHVLVGRETLRVERLGRRVAPNASATSLS